MAIRRASLLCLLLPALAVGCAASHGYDYEVRIDPSFLDADDHGAMVLGAFAEWMDVVPVTMKPIFVKCSGLEDGVICVHRSTMAEVNARYPEYGGRCNAVTDLNSRVDGGEVWFARDAGLPVPYTDLQKQGVLAHEFGHAMGLTHHAGHFLMDVSMDYATAIVPTEGDIAEWLSVR